MKFVDLSQDPPCEVTVYTLREIATRIQSGYGSYALTATFESWINDYVIATPPSDYTISEVDYWKPERVSEWQELHNVQKELEEERRVKKLGETSYSVIEIVDQLITFAEEVERSNRYCQSHNRGNSMRDGRLRVIQLEGAIDFVSGTIFRGVGLLPNDKRQKLNELLSQSKAHVKMQ